MSPPNGVHFATPEALAGDKLSSLEARMVFSNTATGEIVLDLPTSSEGGGSPLLGTYSASGNLQTARGTLDATVSLTLIGSTAGPTISDIHITGRTTPEGYRISCHTNVLGAGTGVISNEAGALIATMETTSLGGIIYPVGGTAESFSF